MDPNETLRLLRLTIGQMRVDEDPGVRRAHADEIGDYFDALDGWLRNGGFLPADWQRRDEQGWKDGVQWAIEQIRLRAKEIR